MRKILFVLAGLLLAPWGASAQTQSRVCYSLVVGGVLQCINVSAANPMPVAATITPSGTQDVNLTQVGGTATASGSGTATGALRVELPTNGTGVVGLNAGSAIVGRVGIDQTTPGTTNLVAAGQNGTWNIGTVTTLTTLSQFGGQAINLGNGTVGTGTLRVTIASDSTGVIGTAPAASATGGYSFLNIPAGQATTTVKSGAGTLHSIILNSAATATNTTTVYDNTAGSETVIGRPAVTTATVPTTLIYDLAFATGLTIVTAAANGGDMTITYK